MKILFNRRSTINASVAGAGYFRLALFVLLLFPHGAVEAESSSLVSGIYSESQAESGVDLYNTYCAHCHLPRFYTNIDVTWNDMRVLDFYYKMSGSMPADNPRTLGQAQYLKLVAWVLTINGYPSGNTSMSLNNKLGMMKFGADKTCNNNFRHKQQQQAADLVQKLYPSVDKDLS